MSEPVYLRLTVRPKGLGTENFPHRVSD